MTKSKLFFNKRWAFWIVIFSFLLLFGIWTFDEETIASIGVIAVASLLLLGYVLLFPNSYRLDEKGKSFE